MEREIAMTEVEFREQVEQDDGRGDLSDQIHGVRLEVEKVRTEMTGQIGGLERKLCDRIGEVGLEVEKLRTEMTGQNGDLETKMGGLETRNWSEFGSEDGWVGDQDDRQDGSIGDETF